TIHAPSRSPIAALSLIAFAPPASGAVALIVCAEGKTATRARAGAPAAPGSGSSETAPPMVATASRASLNRRERMRRITGEFLAGGCKFQGLQMSGFDVRRGRRVVRP